MKMMKMNEENQGAGDRSVGSVATPKFVCSQHRAWPGTNRTWRDLLGRVFLTHTQWDDTSAQCGHREPRLDYSL